MSEDTYLDEALCRTPIQQLSRSELFGRIKEIWVVPNRHCEVHDGLFRGLAVLSID